VLTKNPSFGEMMMEGDKIIDAQIFKGMDRRMQQDRPNLFRLTGALERLFLVH
jgi:hypothetical protein